MPRKPYGRRSLRESLESSQAGLRAWSAFSGKPIPSELVKVIPPKKTRVRRTSDPARPLERHVLKAVTQALRLDPRVAMVERNQSGVFQEGNRYIRVGSRGKLDLTVLLTSGKYAEIEVKRPGEKPKPHQLERIAAIRSNGGISGYCWSIESALALLP